MLTADPRRLCELQEAARAQALARYEALRPHIEDGVALRLIAAERGLAPRSLERWLWRYRRGGLAALARSPRSDRARRRLPEDLVALAEGLALSRPPPSLAQIHRQVAEIARARGLAAPSYASVRRIVRALDPGLVCLAQEGRAAYRERFELVHRHEAGAPNALWQADHSRLAYPVAGPAGAPLNPWLSVILDDHSRAVCGYLVGLEAPSALVTALCLHQGIWRKTDPAWRVCGIPETLYVDHGSDFTSRHIEQVCADLRIRLVHSSIGVPQGRGKVERFFATLDQMLLSRLRAERGRRGARSTPSLAELDAAIRAFIVSDYHRRPHAETGQPPHERWEAGGFLPRTADSLEALDLLLLHVARPRTVQRDGIRFQGLRYFDLGLAAWVGERVTIRYDPRDLAEIRVFCRERFICRALCAELSGEKVGLRELVAARNTRRRELLAHRAEREALVERLIGVHRTPPRPAPAPASRLKRYRDEE